MVSNGRLSELQTLAAQVDDIDTKMRGLREGFKSLAVDLDSMKLLQGKMARYQGLDYEEEDNEN